MVLHSITSEEERARDLLTRCQRLVGFDLGEQGAIRPQETHPLFGHRFTNDQDDTECLVEWDVVDRALVLDGSQLESLPALAVEVVRDEELDGLGQRLAAFADRRADVVDRFERRIHRHCQLTIEEFVDDGGPVDGIGGIGGLRGRR